MAVTKHAIEMMGFKEYPECDLLEIHFGIIRAYSLQGVSFWPDSKPHHSEVISFGENCTVAVSNSINEACQLLTDDKFIDDDEEEWIKKNKISRPFVLIYFKEFQPRLLKGGYRKEQDGNLFTYDAFPEGKKDIRKWEKESLPNIYTALIVHLSTLDNPASLHPVARSVFGTTQAGKNLFDYKITSSGTLVFSPGKTDVEINESLKRSSILHNKLTYESSRHIYLALNESDKFKQFMSYFMFLERYTHTQFKSLNYEDGMCTIIKAPARINQSVKLFFESSLKETKNLAQKFNWCTMLAWHQLSDQDVKDFLEIKKIRDQLTHGEDVDEKDLPIEKARMLVLKLLGTE